MATATNRCRHSWPRRAWTPRGHVPLGRFCRQSAVDGAWTEPLSTTSRAATAHFNRRRCHTACIQLCNDGRADKIFISMTCSVAGRAARLPDTAGWRRIWPVYNHTRMPLLLLLLLRVMKMAVIWARLNEPSMTDDVSTLLASLTVWSYFTHQPSFPSRPDPAPCKNLTARQRLHPPICITPLLQ